jgi:hypothetical protein
MEPSHGLRSKDIQHFTTFAYKSFAKENFYYKSFSQFSYDLDSWILSTESTRKILRFLSYVCFNVKYFCYKIFLKKLYFRKNNSFENFFTFDSYKKITNDKKLPVTLAVFWLLLLDSSYKGQNLKTMSRFRPVFSGI